MRACILTLLTLLMLSTAYGNGVPMEVQRAKIRRPNLRIKPKRVNKTNPGNHPISIHQYHHSSSQQTRERYTFYPGSLKANITHIAREFGWRTVVWQPQYDYQWVGKTRIGASNIQELLTKVLHDFPLQAVFYQGNHVLVIVARNIP